MSATFGRSAHTNCGDPRRAAVLMRGQPEDRWNHGELLPETAQQTQLFLRAGSVAVKGNARPIAQQRARALPKPVDRGVSHRTLLIKTIRYTSVLSCARYEAMKLALGVREARDNTPYFQ
jgi:hypothetical protein